ncbi:MAG: ATP-binding protein [Sphaerochaetaceae bacterium]
MIGKRIRTRLMLLTLAVLSLAMLGSLLISLGSLTAILKKSTYSALEENATYVKELLAQSPQGFDVRELDAYAHTTDQRITLIRANGEVLYDSVYDTVTLDNHLGRTEVQAALTQGTGKTERDSTTQRVPVLYYAVRIDQHPTVAVIRLSSLLSELSGYRRSYSQAFAEGLLVLLFLTFTVTFLSIRKITRPLEEIHETARRYAGGDLGARSAVDSPQELSDLSKTLNTMATQLQNQIADIESSRQQYSIILDSLVEGILFIDPQMVIVEANQAAITLLSEQEDGDIGDEVKGLRLVQILGSSEILAACGRSLAGEGFQELEIARYGHLFGDTATMIGRKGTRLLRIGISAVVRSNTITGLVMSINDTTELKRLEQIRKDFVANVSHELKTPITAIAGFTNVLSEGALENPETARRYLQIITRQVIQMQHIVEDLLLLSSLEQNNAAPVRTWTMVNQIAEEAMEACRYKAEEKHTTVNLAINNPQDLQILANGMLVVQALSNLLVNAITYSDENSTVDFTIEVGEPEVAFVVRDKGYGIPKEALERIFERFYRVDKARSRKQGGTGLGLSIVKHIVQVHGGTVSVVSEEGVGSTFTITLPRCGGELVQMRKNSTRLYPRTR